MIVRRLRAASFAIAPLPRTAPAGGENPQGFHPFVKPLPNSGRKSSGMAGLSLSGMKTHRVFIPM
ncbi:MAG: hypothetical protein LBK61_07065 [Spirochaetaceae bacterium]|nr:hypothetical protein [Spirochaetaceae bacterium]